MILKNIVFSSKLAMLLNYEQSFLLLCWLFCQTPFFRGIPLRSEPRNFPKGSLFPQNNENISESIPRNFFGMEFRWQPPAGQVHPQIMMI
jgi:hypothetical protein